MAFATGTSFGTFIMIPIRLQMAVPMEAHLPLVIGAVVSGGILEIIVHQFRIKLSCLRW